MDTLKMTDGSSSTTANAENVMTQPQWQALGERLFGHAGRDWKYACPRCGGIQSAAEFFARGLSKEEALHSAATQCLKRKAAVVRGNRELRADECDWVSWGLFQGPWFVVTDPSKIVNGEVSREFVVGVFPFAGVTDEDVKMVKEEIKNDEVKDA